MQSWCRERRTFERMVEGTGSVVPGPGGDETSPASPPSLTPFLKLPWMTSLLESEDLSKRDLKGWLAVETALMAWRR